MKKYYAVRKGKKPGIYLTWDECKENVTGFSGAEYKSFKSYDEATIYMGATMKNNNISKKELKNISNIDAMDFKMEKDKLYAFVDGSYNINTDTVGYGLVLVKNNEIQFKDLGSFRKINFNESKSVFGELRGALKAVELAIANDFKDICIVYDYIGISKFATKEWKAKAGVTRDYQTAMNRYRNLIDIKFQKVKSHALESDGGSRFNEIADKLAKMGSKL